MHFKQIPSEIKQNQDQEEREYLALGTRPGIWSWNSGGRPRKPWKRSKVTWVMWWTLVGHPVSMGGWGTAEITSSGGSTRHDTIDFLKAPNSKGTMQLWSLSCGCWAVLPPPLLPFLILISNPTSACDSQLLNPRMSLFMCLVALHSRLLFSSAIYEPLS